MSQSPVTTVDSSDEYDGYDRSIWNTSDKPHPTLSDSVAFEAEWRSSTATPTA